MTYVTAESFRRRPPIADGTALGLHWCYCMSVLRGVHVLAESEDRAMELAAPALQCRPVDVVARYRLSRSGGVAGICEEPK